MTINDATSSRLIFEDLEININELFFEVSDGLKLKVFHLHKINCQNTKKIIFLPGYISTIYSWRHFLPILTNIGDIYYIESREKSSSINNSQNYKINFFVDDISHTINKLNLKEGDYYLIGSSLGATTILEGLSKGIFCPVNAVLILPNARFKIPKFINVLRPFPRTIKIYITHILIFFALKLKTNKSDIGQKERFLLATKNADFDKLIYSAFELSKYKLYFKDLDRIKTKVLIINASEDHLHNVSDIYKIYRSIKNCQYFDVKSHTNSRNSVAGEVVYDFIQLEHA